MTNSPGSFFSEFSIRDLLKKNEYLAAHIQQVRMGGIGGGGGGIGDRPGAVRSRQESFTFGIDAASGRGFDAAQFMDSIRADVQAEIKTHHLAITANHNFRT